MTPNQSQIGIRQIQTNFILQQTGPTSLPQPNRSIHPMSTLKSNQPSLPQKRLNILQSESPNQAKRPAPDPTPAFDLTALLNSKPIAIEVSVGPSGVSGQKQAKETITLDEDSPQKKIPTPPMTQTGIVNQVPEGLNLKQLLDIEIRK